jgi:hypothetical protein
MKKLALLGDPCAIRSQALAWSGYGGGGKASTTKARLKPPKPLNLTESYRMRYFSSIIISLSVLISGFTLALPALALAQTYPPLSFDDPYFNGVTEFTSAIKLQNNESFSNSSIVESSGNPSLTCLGACTINRVRIESREGIRVAGNGTVAVTNSVMDTTGIPNDHADGLQAYAPGSVGTIALSNVTFVTHTSLTHTGMFIADNWTGTITMNNVVFNGNGAAYAFRIYPDIGGDIHISLNNVYLIGPFQYAPFDMKSVAGHNVIADQWNNVRNATIVNGVLVSGSLIPCRSGNVICPSGGDTTPPSTPTK